MNDEDNILTPQLYPPWKEAVRSFLDQNFPPGEVVPHEWFWTAMGMEKPPDDMPLKEGERQKLLFLTQFSPFRLYLLTEHRIDLAAKPGMGYYVVPPGEQTPLAYEEGVAELREALKKMGRRLINVEHAALTDRQRQENAEALAKLSMLDTMRRRARRLPVPD